MNRTPHNPPGHIAILASAGSGKTTRLTRRYIELLAKGTTPDRICALTFTRKAAGEIFDRIVSGLSQAAAGIDRAGLKKAMPGLEKNDYLRMLRLFLENLNRTAIGTMDSFVVGVARAFPMELGVPFDFRVLDGDDMEGKWLRQDVLASILAADEAGNLSARAFMEAFKQATFGVEYKNFGRVMDDIINSFHQAYRLCSDGKKWGYPGVGMTEHIGNDKVASGALDSQADAVIAWLADSRELNGQFRDSLASIVDALRSHTILKPWSKTFSGVLFSRLLTQKEELWNGKGMLEYRRKQIEVPPEISRALGALIAHLFAVEIVKASRTTRGLYELMKLYDQGYDKVSRESGRFSFNDIQYLLASGNISEDPLLLSRERGEQRLFIDFRMDCRLDHWLLDEFQDTSDLQWAVFKNLVSELVQSDPSGNERSFFYVGDVKQSVYRWRGGNPDLFLDIRDEFNQTDTIVNLEKMAGTYRCSTQVVDAVNRVFSDLPGGFLSASALEKWKAAWIHHETFNTDAPGYAVLLETEPVDVREESVLAEARYRLAADLLNTIQPLKRGLSVGILMRDNKACGSIVNALRRDCPGMSFTHEGRANVLDNELAQLMLSLVSLAAHPGDMFAWQHIAMSPFALVLRRNKITRSNIAPRLLTDIEKLGFKAFIRQWGDWFDEVHPLNDYGRACLDRLENAAASFDETVAGDCNRFVQYITDYSAHEGTAGNSIRVMTVHQAKGLEFDIVILPQLQHINKMNMTRADSSDLIFAGNRLAPDWILSPPKREIAENDPVVGAQIKEQDARHCFDYLCLLYVAMTRARHGLYMITTPAKPPAPGDAFRPDSLLKMQLTDVADGDSAPKSVINGSEYTTLYSSDAEDANWYESFQEVAPVKKAVSPPPADFTEISERSSGREVLRRLEPSKQELFELSASGMFDPETRDVLDFGTAIHELFEEIEWLDNDVSAAEIIDTWRPSRRFDKQVVKDVATQFKQCLKSPEVRAALSKPQGNVELWREKSFELILDGSWVSGVFDRVVINRGFSGEPLSAEILDYKSNRNLVSEDDAFRKAKHYFPQMDIYRRALSFILGIEKNRVAVKILFTVPAKIVAIPDSCI